MSLSSDGEEKSLLNSTLAVSYSGGDPFSVKMNQDKAKRRHRGVVNIGEHTPPYSILKDHNLLVTAFRKETFDDVFIERDLSPNSSLAQNFAKRWKWGVYWTPGCGFLLYKLLNKEIIVPAGHISCFTDEDNNYVFAKPGVYNIQDPFMKQVSQPIPIHGAEFQRNVIEHGNRTVLTVPQGMLGIASDMGQPLLLPPGLHSWVSETIRFDRMYRLDDSPILQLGPYTILTVDDGYVAITINNGKQVIMEGGQTYLLTHQKWRFERFMNMKLQSDELRKVTAATADNLLISLDAVTTWKVCSAQEAALMITETVFRSDISIDETGTEEDVGSVAKLRRHVIKQVISGLAKFVGSIHYSDYFLYIRSLLNPNENNIEEDDNDSEVDRVISNPFFDDSGMEEAVLTANKITKKFGVEVIGISIISATPINQNITSSLALGAVSSAEALQIEAKAKGAAKAAKIEAESEAVAKKITAESEADAALIRAKAEAEAEILRSDGSKTAEILRAEGSKQAALLLESSQVAVALETIKASSAAIKDSDKFFFSQEPQYLQQALNVLPHSYLAEKSGEN
mmetsp:Transcript_180/g.261  ORF Transcript_180/g.261 Transcript_180/m.261 type:complete len:569 (-) Transcript_180:1141-2847(-)|eukprot:CAMPEP_0203669390 /NCGR_PEP_ID=MMETSP0090-20130426/5787_1 /ASSEMBLY_ACC=CAM_ASM_001088 /TAXON_ID=426623 /ORGANISM="Chaetoceros affinis, Strain CCMP159" /LENGTH=568 /DNA_ID=CAMNT_0050534077 /DNA_START=21 /DNA_END=1727 /DNA_ORIENTATION=+